MSTYGERLHLRVLVLAHVLLERGVHGVVALEAQLALQLQPLRARAARAARAALLRRALRLRTAHNIACLRQITIQPFKKVMTIKIKSTLNQLIRKVTRRAVIVPYVSLPIRYDST